MNVHVARRGFLKIAAVALLMPRRLAAAIVRGLAQCRNETAAVAEGRRVGVGTARLEGPAAVEVCTHQTWTLVYTAGRAGIKPGGGLRIALRHLQGRAGFPQKVRPERACYLTARADGGVPLTVSIPNGWKVFFTQYFPWQNIVQVTVGEPGLAPGKTVRVTYGDRRGGGPGFPVQSFDERRWQFKVYADPLGNEKYLPVADSPTVEVVAAAPHRATVVMPSDAVVGQSTWCLVRAEDRYGNPAPRYRGTVTLRSSVPSATLPPNHTFTDADRGVHRFDGLKFGATGTHTVKARDGRFEAAGNPVRVARTRPEHLLLWGDLHGHTLYSDGRGTVREYYQSARDVVGLDFCAVSDHAFEILDEMWAHSKAVTNGFNEPGRFVTFNAYEWSGMTPLGGDHNVYFLDDDPPLYRSTSYDDPRNLQMDHGPTPKVRTVEALYARLAAHLENKNVFCIPHWGGRHGNPQFHDPRIQRLIEVFSEHRRSEDWATTFLAAGHRLGIMASTDDHYGNPGYGYLQKVRDWAKQEIGMAAVAVYAPELTRRSVFHALYDRRCYATSGSRILLDLESDGHPMGSEYRTLLSPRLRVRAVGTARIARVEIKKDSQVVQTLRPGDTSVDLAWRDPDFRSDRPCYYYVRILQQDNEEAISSPIWVN